MDFEDYIIEKELNEEKIILVSHKFAEWTSEEKYKFDGIKLWKKWNSDNTFDLYTTNQLFKKFIKEKNLAF